MTCSDDFSALTAGDLPQHLQVMINLLRCEDRIKLVRTGAFSCPSFCWRCLNQISTGSQKALANPWLASVCCTLLPATPHFPVCNFGADPYIQVMSWVYVNYPL